MRHYVKGRPGMPDMPGTPGTPEQLPVEDTQEMEVAVDVCWDDGRRSTWTVAALSSRLDEWNDVYMQWMDGELYTAEAAKVGAPLISL